MLKGHCLNNDSPHPEGFRDSPPQILQIKQIKQTIEAKSRPDEGRRDAYNLSRLNNGRRDS